MRTCLVARPAATLSCPRSLVERDRLRPRDRVGLALMAVLGQGGGRDGGDVARVDAVAILPSSAAVWIAPLATIAKKFCMKNGGRRLV